MSTPHTWTDEKIFWQSRLFIVYNSCNDVSQRNLSRFILYLKTWVVLLPYMVLRGQLIVQCDFSRLKWPVKKLFGSLLFRACPARRGVTGGVSPGGRYLRRVTDSSTRPVMYQHTHDSANEGKASEAHLSVSPCSVSLTLFVCVVSTHQHFKWWEACGNGKAEHAYWVNEARSEASPFVKYRRKRKHQWQKWVEWELSE